MVTLDALKKDLEFYFKTYKFSIGKRIYGRCVIAEKSKFCGADIYIKSNKIHVQAGIPRMKTRLLVGGGAVILKMFSKRYSEPSYDIYEYLSEIHTNVKLVE
ncbi:hypothetical protein [Psychroserpens sp. MEBiC05023]